MVFSDAIVLAVIMFLGSFVGIAVGSYIWRKK